MKAVVVAGIGTGVGKTIISAVLTQALGADYWKPVQAGNLDFTDTDTVRLLTNNGNSVFHPEAYKFKEAAAPCAAADKEGVQIEFSQLTLPQTSNILVIELAGGLMVPLSKTQLNIDLLIEWKLPVLLVSQNYLGSINHTLLSVELLRSCEIHLAGIIFNGKVQEFTQKFIIDHSGAKSIGRINLQSKVTRSMIRRYAGELHEKLSNLL